MSDRLLQNVKFVNALPPDADRFNGDPATDVINMRDYKHCTLILQTGAGSSGTAVVTVESCDNTTPSTTTAISFRYKKITSGDSEGDTTTATASGFTTTASANCVYMIEVDDSDLSGTDKYVRLQLTEDTDSPVDAGVLAILSGASYAGNDMRTVLV